MRPRYIKTSKRISYLSIGYFLVAFLLLISSCQEDEHITLDQELEPTLSYLLSIGFDRGDIVDAGDFYIIEGDMTMDKVGQGDLSKTLNHKTQRYEPGLIGGPNQLEITLSFDSTVPSGDPWRAAFAKAVNEWNAVESSLHFVLLGDNDPAADTEIFYHISVYNEAGPFTSALADLPVSDQSGPRIRLNPLLGATYTQLMFDNAAAHEMGHTVGFWHTDSPNDGIHLPGSPLIDNSSVFNASAKPWAGFSAGDLYSIGYLYPAPQFFPGDFSGNGAIGMALRNENYFRIDNDLNGTFDDTYHFSSAPDHKEYFIGKWTGSSASSVAYRDGSTFHYDSNYDGVVDGTYTFGSANADQYYIGDWDGNGVVSAAYRIGQTFYVDKFGNGSIVNFTFTNSSAEEYFVGDWDNNGTQTFSYRIGKYLYTDNGLDGTVDTSNWLRVVLFPGQSIDSYYAGDWSGSGQAGMGALVGNKFWLDSDFNFFPDIIFTHSY